MVYSHIHSEEKAESGFTSSLATAPKTPLTPLDSPESLRIDWRLSSRLDGTLNTRSCMERGGGEGVGTGAARRVRY